eukprot:8168666-Pyramimonas_sp.AAC.3
MSVRVHRMLRGGTPRASPRSLEVYHLPHPNLTLAPPVMYTCRRWLQTPMVGGDEAYTRGEDQSYARVSVSRGNTDGSDGIDRR